MDITEQATRYWMAELPRIDHDGEDRWLVYVNRHGAIRRERIHECAPPPPPPQPPCDF